MPAALLWVQFCGVTVSAYSPRFAWGGRPHRRFILDRHTYTYTCTYTYTYTYAYTDTDTYTYTHIHIF